MQVADKALLPGDVIVRLVYERESEFARLTLNNQVSYVLVKDVATTVRDVPIGPRKPACVDAALRVLVADKSEQVLCVEHGINGVGAERLLLDAR